MNITLVLKMEKLRSREVVQDDTINLYQKQDVHPDLSDSSADTPTLEITNSNALPTGLLSSVTLQKH